MRRVHRVPLGARELAYLAKKEKECSTLPPSDSRITPTWEAARKTKPLQRIRDELAVMAGPRERCMYCVDSHACDIEHFWPKSPYPQRMFLWENLLFCCTECGRFKRNDFPLNGALPLLIDPTVEDPWDYLEFDPQTGNISPRYDAVRHCFLEKGDKTVEVLHLDRREALSEGYRKTWKRLVKCVNNFLHGGSSETIFLSEIHDEDDHGLLGWCMTSRGAQEHPFDALHQQHPGVCSKIRANVT